MHENDVLGILAIFSIIIPTFLFVAFIKYDQKKRKRQH